MRSRPRFKLDDPARFKKSSADKTSRDAARVASVKAPSLRATILGLMIEKACPLSAEEIVSVFADRGQDVLFTTARSRLSDLKNLGLVEPSGDYGKAYGGCRAIRWRLVTAAIAAMAETPEVVINGA